MKYRVAVVDDRAINTVSLAEEINLSGEATVVFTAINGKDYLEKLKKLPKNELPQAVLMDIEMPVMDGIEAVRRSSALYPGLHYIMLTVFDDDDKIFEAIQAGAHGYLLKEEKSGKVLEAIKEVVEKSGAPMSPRIARKTLGMLQKKPVLHTAPAKNETDLACLLTEREAAILECLVNGLNNKETGDRLFISPNTVRNHIVNIYDKLHICNRSQAVTLALKNKWYEK